MYYNFSQLKAIAYQGALDQYYFGDVSKEEYEAALKRQKQRELEASHAQMLKAAETYKKDRARQTKQDEIVDNIKERVNPVMDKAGEFIGNTAATVGNVVSSGAKAIGEGARKGWRSLVEGTKQGIANAKEAVAEAQFRGAQSGVEKAQAKLDRELIKKFEKGQK